MTETLILQGFPEMECKELWYFRHRIFRICGFFTTEVTDNLGDNKF